MTSEQLALRLYLGPRSPDKTSCLPLDARHSWDSAPVVAQSVRLLESNALGRRQSPDRASGVDHRDGAKPKKMGRAGTQDASDLLPLVRAPGGFKRTNIGTREGILTLSSKIRAQGAPPKSRMRQTTREKPEKVGTWLPSWLPDAQQIASAEESADYKRFMSIMSSRQAENFSSTILTSF